MKVPQMRLAQRITLVFSLVVFLVTGASLVATESHFRDSLNEACERKALQMGRMMADVARPHLQSSDHSTLQQVVEEVVDGVDVVYLVVLDERGQTVASAGHRAPESSAPPKQSLTQGAAAEIRHLEWTGGEAPISIIESVVPLAVSDSDERGASVCLGLSMERVAHQLFMARVCLLVFGLCEVLAAILAALFLARRISRPLRQLVEATELLESGDWDPTFRIGTGDEIAELAERFSTVAASLDEQNRRLLVAKEEQTALNTGLEDQVRRRTAELTASREKYRLLVQGSPDAYVLLDGNRFVFVNPAFARIFELTQEEAESSDLTWEDVVHQNFHEKVREQFLELSGLGRTFDTEWTGQTREGRSIDLEVRGRVVRYQDREIFELVLTEVTEKKALIQQIFYNERLRAMGEMTALVAHHFNNILAIIHGRAQLIQRKVKDEKLVESLGVIQSSVQKAGGMVRHLQDFFGEQVDLRFVELDINALLEETIHYQEKVWSSTRSAGSPPISVRLELAELPPVRGAAPLLQDAFGRVLTNAVEAMPGGGEIVVQTSVDNDQVVLAFRDTGVGLDAETAMHAFDPFFSTKETSGRGLGLSASQGILQRHEGQIRIESEVGRGAVVTIVLPVQSAVSKVIPFAAERSPMESNLRAGS